MSSGLSTGRTEYHEDNGKTKRELSQINQGEPIDLHRQSPLVKLKIFFSISGYDCSPKEFLSNTSTSKPIGKKRKTHGSNFSLVLPIAFFFYMGCTGEKLDPWV
jgi:hypothetical protein